MKIQVCCFIGDGSRNMPFPFFYADASPGEEKKS
jgi:hypothetical protein